MSFVPTVLELDLQDIGAVGGILRVLGHQVQVSWSMFLKKKKKATQIHSISHACLVWTINAPDRRTPHEPGDRRKMSRREKSRRWAKGEG